MIDSCAEVPRAHWNLSPPLKELLTVMFFAKLPIYLSRWSHGLLRGLVE